MEVQYGHIYAKNDYEAQAACVSMSVNPKAGPVFTSTGQGADKAPGIYNYTRILKAADDPKYMKFYDAATRGGEVFDFPPMKQTSGGTYFKYLCLGKPADDETETQAETAKTMVTTQLQHARQSGSKIDLWQMAQNVANTVGLAVEAVLYIIYSVLTGKYN